MVSEIEIKTRAQENSSEKEVYLKFARDSEGIWDLAENNLESQYVDITLLIQALDEAQTLIEHIEDNYNK